MEEVQSKKKSLQDRTPREIFDDLLERSRELDELVDDHQGMIIGERSRAVKIVEEESENQ